VPINYDATKQEINMFFYYLNHEDWFESTNVKFEDLDDINM